MTSNYSTIEVKAEEIEYKIFIIYIECDLSFLYSISSASTSIVL